MAENFKAFLRMAYGAWPMAFFVRRKKPAHAFGLYRVREAGEIGLEGIMRVNAAREYPRFAFYKSVIAVKQV